MQESIELYEVLQTYEYDGNAGGTIWQKKNPKSAHHDYNTDIQLEVKTMDYAEAQRRIMQKAQSRRAAAM